MQIYLFSNAPFSKSLSNSESSYPELFESYVINSKQLLHQNRTIVIASDFRVDGAKSPEILQKEKVLGSEIAARNHKSLATFHRTLKSQCSTLIFFSLFFREKARKTTKKARIFHLLRTPKILEKGGENTQKSEEFLEKQKSKEIQKSKEKKIRALLCLV